MTILFLILIVTACVALAFIILIQNPKGGGLASNVGGLSNQFMGVKQTTDVLEKGTWIFAIIIALLSIFSTFFFSGKQATSDTSILNKVNTNSTAPAPQSAAPANTVPATQQPKKP
jgi:preprotein translocase subunit SecG